MPTLPETMILIDHGKGGAPEVLVPQRGPLPQPKPDEVLIRVLATGVNRPDVAQRKGEYPPPPGASSVIGLETAGEVVAVGPEAGAWKVGDKVCALTNGGAYAEYCTAPAAQCLPWPKGFDAIRAAALPETFFTVWANLFGHGRLAAGETVLVHGGTSGIGVTAIQLAKAFGATVIATAGSAAKCEAMRGLGADVAIDYRTQDFVAEVKRATDGRLADVVLDMVGADYFNRNLRCLGMDGRLVIIAFLGGFEVAKADLRPVMTRRLTVTGSTMRPRTTAQKGAIAAALREKVWPLLEAGRCAPPIYQVFPLDQAAAAHALMESSQHIGKIMLKVAE
ncbi:NAD(P)H quinone oxidoreductase [Siccirubricoccus deserti]|uniref:NAD(P)H-quinone oxidoreductase n=1 Tax=Siccirubricoccus deserti TaxID=2013562 RepID=A0A9X0QYN6_9PROT|nr:NAD(P)H-quinone oxidoreductase [Siccirubricoccus deserti]MBC4016020.1 NAD(P)H-quinone oxidoreductase [Siccirubricoccus deserti]GGC40022.1 NAD(P)H quinone oxidoreductase [Siccirubricoccus deserti]